jgi:soluble lytic murein transglycosylase
MWYLAWSYYMQKDYDKAIERINGLLGGKENHKMEDRLLYWKARCLEFLGRNDEARSLYSEILGDHPIGYYGVLSKRHLDGDEREFANFGLVSPEKSSKAKNATEYPAYEKVRPTSPHLSKAFFFDRLSLHEEAARELAAASGEKADTNLILTLAARNFAHDIAFQIVYQRYASILRSTPVHSGFENFIWEMSYPESYKPVVERLAGKTLDPRLVYAIMRAESNFRPRVVSPAGAVGLMQLMPVTAQKMAMEIGNRGFDTRDLYRPSKNIEYGIEYLNKLDNLFPDNTVAIIASYNAGEEAVGRWLKHGYSNDVEEFIEEIPYDETNLYVKKVMMSYWILQRLYP